MTNLSTDDAVTRYRQTAVTVSDKAVRGGNVCTVSDTDISSGYCPDHSGSPWTITPCFLNEKHEKPALPERLGSSLNHSHTIIAKPRIGELARFPEPITTR
ncbi:hypothetical protein PSAC2689_290012 [Paraburkholderia sacchari]